VEDELADAVIRIADMCGAFGIDLERHVVEKLEYNRHRPRTHGKVY
jgi:NTP pyrophosphatase (non-canonical NTP hydrolase)